MSASVSDTVHTFFSEFPLVPLRKGDRMLHPDMPIRDVFYMTKGLVRMYGVSPDGEEITLHIFRPNTYFPVMFVFSHSAHKYFFEVLEAGEAYKAPAPAVIRFLKQEPDVLFDLTTRFSDAICGLLVRLEHQASEHAPVRVMRVLLYLANRFGEKAGSNITIPLILRHEDIANWVGLRRETVSRLCKKLEHEQLIRSKDHRFTIIDKDALQRAIQTQRTT